MLKKGGSSLKQNFNFYVNLTFVYIIKKNYMLHVLYYISFNATVKFDLYLLKLFARMFLANTSTCVTFF